MKKPNIFEQLRQKSHLDKQRINEIDVDLAGCVEVIKKYGESLKQISRDLTEIQRYMLEIQGERERLMGDSR